MNADIQREILQPLASSPTAWCGFDAEWYAAVNPGVAAAGALAHYLESGRATGLSPNMFFDETWYRASNPDVAEAIGAGDIGSGYEHYCTIGYTTRSPHWLYDDATYALYAPDLTDQVLVTFSCANRYDHYLKAGAREGRIAHLLFQPAIFRAAAGEMEDNAFVGFLRRAWRGEAELVCSPYFDPTWYAAHTPALATAQRSLGALHHFLTAPAGDRGEPRAEFSSSYYVAGVPEAGDGRFASPFEHFLKVGVFALRSPAEGIDLAGYVEGDPTAREDIAEGRVRDAFAHLLAHRTPAAAAEVAVATEVVVAEPVAVVEKVAEQAGTIVPDVFGSHYFIGVDDAILCPPDGIVLIGWMLAPAGSFTEFTVVCGGRRVRLDPAGFVPTMRTDVIKEVGGAHGYHDPMCGFMAYAAGALEPGEVPVLEIRRPNGEIVIRNIATPKLQGLAAIRALLDRFELRNAPMGRAFDAVIGPAMTALGRTHLAEPTTWEIQDFGAVEAAPEVSVIVPLYGRIGLMEYQLALISAEGPGIAHELIYVLDDPAQRRAAEEMALSLFARFAVPFRLVMLSRNTGYAPANNIGLSVARGRQICLMNSDVFPRDAGWLARLSARLDGAPELGAVGPLLLFEDGSVQHQGMSFAALPEFAGWWFPLHDRKGRRPLVDGGARTATAITGACMLIGRETLSDLGGLDPRYLIGDFEDSDLCLKLAAKGLKVAVDHDVAMYHLERQSQASAAQRWRMNLTLYNAWQHQRRWGGTISAMVAP